MLAASFRILTHPYWLELREYLGADFDPDLCNGKDDKVIADFSRYATPEEFYRETSIYLYHSIGYFFEGLKRPYYGMLFNATANRHVSILDYGCGPGLDGVLFAMAGYSVSFADVPSKSLEYLKWRLHRRGYPVDVYTIGEDDDIPCHHIVWCMDVLEHMLPDKQTALLDRLSALGNTVMVNLVNDAEADGRVHHSVDVAELTEYVAGKWNYRKYDFYDNRVRLLVYGSVGDE